VTMMSPDLYTKIRKAIGSRLEVARLLDIHPETLRKRECGYDAHPISAESALAILSLSTLVEDVEVVGETIEEALELYEPHLISVIIARGRLE